MWAVDPDKWIDRLLRIWTAVRPLAHTRLTLVALALGGAILVGPLWEPFVRSAVHHYLSIELDPLTKPIWGLAVIGIAFAYHAAVTYFTLRPPHRAEASHHDISLAEKLRSDFPHQDIVEVANDVGGSHRYYGDSHRKFRELARFLQRPENEFVDLECRNAADVLREAVVSFSNFLAQHFFVFPDRQRGENWQFAMYPELTWDTGAPTPEQEEIYRARARELNETIDALEGAFDEFHRLLNQRVRSQTIGEV